MKAISHDLKVDAAAVKENMLRVIVGHKEARQVLHFEGSGRYDVLPVPQVVERCHVAGDGVDAKTGRDAERQRGE